MCVNPRLFRCGAVPATKVGAVEASCAGTSRRGGVQHRCTQSPLRGAGLTQLAIECVEFSDALLPRSMSVWKKSASVVANESALIVTVLTCISSASVISSVRQMALW